MSDIAIETLYRQTFNDRNVSPEESSLLTAHLQSLQQISDGSTSTPMTPDQIVWFRATAFRIACEYLDDCMEENVKLLKALNAVVHALETTCLLPNLEEEGGDSFSKEAVEQLLCSLYETQNEDHDDDDEAPSISKAEALALTEFLTDASTRPPLKSLVWLRATAFRLGSQYLDGESNKEKNDALLRSINVVVHIIETTCMRIKPLSLELPPSHSPTASTDFCTAVNTLWKLDSNRLNPNSDYTIDVQRSKHPCNKDDAAHYPLFTYVRSQVFSSRPTFKAFRDLLNNYSAAIGEEEEVTEQELAENKTFLEAIMKTAVMKYCHQYCLAKEASYNGRPVPASESGFMKILNSIWFESYSRSGGGRSRKMDSSGFEHVFVGEVKNGQISGFHNWIQFYLEEKAGHVDYRGYIKPRSRKSTAETNNDNPVLTLQFSWNGVEKFVSTSFIGVSPEFEVALYTMTFLTGDDENEVTLDTGGESFFDLNVKCHKYDGGSKVGSCYVEALAHYD
eukprot:CAMPEP_0176485866 /NCGR_PEP_ID=MMETSP0200_2-20121128/5267_1 /TAXON_ID=947934 /ORGANISM="Chaetoceros sp., Strain GSL56" /LENGTH=507 /DNA_ID=CAMNT_0017882537 /DNA_START=368 /DNA_END=1891 /DNA_ORIENTATION=+